MNNKFSTYKPFFSFSRRLFLSVILLFWLFVGAFVAYQYHREKTFKIALLNSQLQDFNFLFGDVEKGGDVVKTNFIRTYARQHQMKNLRATIIARNGKVLYDNDEADVRIMTNHLNRTEVQQALASGTGYSIKRGSKTFGKDYFYSATYFSDKGIIIRSALPYDLNLMSHLQADSGYLWFTFALTVILSIVFYDLTRRLGNTISQLRRFAQKADHDEPIGEEEMKNLSAAELGDISRHIIDIYKRLRKTRDDLFIEREKLISHLQLSHEGLAIFKPDKQLLLANGFFTQYGNLLSDRNLSRIEDVFEIEELQPLLAFINRTKHYYTVSKEKRQSITIDKNGRIFTVEAIVFQDNTFEISINDITQQEEQARLKRQITQNVAHELKTPVSSIQGYLETIVNTPNLSPDKLQQFLMRCYAQSNRLSNLLQDISVLTRMDEASGLIERENVDLVPLVSTVQQDLALLLEEKEMRVIYRLPEKMPIDGNSSLLYSIFRNLMDNAIAYAGIGKTIHISCFRQDEEFYYISFADNGVGVPEEHLNRLFERFYRVDKGRSRKLGGTGLGLAIVKNAVLFHGGTIDAKSVPGGGIEFVFSLHK